MTEAKIVNEEDKLNTAICHLGLCPSHKCDDDSPMTIWASRSKVREMHLESHPSCEGDLDCRVENRVEEKGKGKGKKKGMGGPWRHGEAVRLCVAGAKERILHFGSRMWGY